MKDNPENETGYKYKEEIYIQTEERGGDIIRVPVYVVMKDNSEWIDWVAGFNDHHAERKGQYWTELDVHVWVAAVDTGKSIEMKTIYAPVSMSDKQKAGEEVMRPTKLIGRVVKAGSTWSINNPREPVPYLFLDEVTSFRQDDAAKPLAAELHRDTDLIAVPLTEIKEDIVMVRQPE